MKDQTIVAVSLFAVLVVGMIGVLGLAREQTGAAMIESPGCTCMIQSLDYYGNKNVETVQHIRTPTRGGPEYCQTRCEVYFGRSTHARSFVVGEEE